MRSIQYLQFRTTVCGKMATVPKIKINRKHELFIKSFYETAALSQLSSYWNDYGVEKKKTIEP